MLWRMENGDLDYEELKSVVIFIGTNIDDWSPEDIFEGIVKLVETVKTKLGDVSTIVLVINCF